MSTRTGVTVRLWILACALGALGSIAGRCVYYGSVTLPEALEGALQRMLGMQSLLTLAAIILDLRALGPVSLVVVLIAVVRRSWLITRSNGRLHLRSWALCMLWGAVLLNNGLFDANRYVSSVAWMSMPLLALPSLRQAERWRWLAKLPRPTVIVSVVAAAGALAAPDLADAAAVALWAGLLLLAVGPGERRVGWLERTTVLLLAMPLVQMLPAVLPRVLPLHGGTHLGEGLAYSFCESPSRRTLYATVPSCPTSFNRLEECKRGFVEVIDLEDVSVRERLSPMSDRFFGRMEQLVCLEDRLQIGMNRTIFEGERQLEDAMELAMDDPHDVRPHLLGEAGGHRILHDRTRDALLYVGDDVHTLHRIERAGGRHDRIEGTGPAEAGVISAALHQRRNSFFALTVNGLIREVDLTTLEVKETFRHAGGIEIQVDEELDRIIVSGFWGVEVIDLQSGEPLLRRRLGLFARPATIDPHRGALYIPTTVEGKLHVFDRRTFERWGQIPIGYGSRYPHVTGDGTRLFGSNEWAHFHWDMQALARRWER